MGCCSAPNCKNSTEGGFRLFRFPQNDTKRFKKWLINSRRDKWKSNFNTRLCEVHFEASQFEQNRQDQWRKLRPDAIAIIFDVPNPPPSLESKIHQTRRASADSLNISASNSLTDSSMLQLSQDSEKNFLKLPLHQMNLAQTFGMQFLYLNHSFQTMMLIQMRQWKSQNRPSQNSIVMRMWSSVKT